MSTLERRTSRVATRTTVHHVRASTEVGGEMAATRAKTTKSAWHPREDVDRLRLENAIVESLPSHPRSIRMSRKETRDHTRMHADVSKMSPRAAGHVPLPLPNQTKRSHTMRHLLCTQRTNEVPLIVPDQLASIPVQQSPPLTVLRCAAISLLLARPP